MNLKTFFYIFVMVILSFMSCSKDDDDETISPKKEEKKEVKGPRIVSSIPVDKSKNVDPNADIIITFDREVEIIPKGYAEIINEFDNMKFVSKYPTYFKVKRIDSKTLEDVTVQKSFELSEDKKTLTIPKSILFGNGGDDRFSSLDIRGIHTLHLNGAVRDVVTKKSATDSFSFSVKKFSYGYYHEGKDSKYVEPADWNSKWKDQYLSDFQISALKEGKKLTNYSYAKGLNLTGDDIRIGVYDGPIAPESIEYQAVIYSNVYYPSNKYLPYDVDVLSGHGTRMARYMLDYAPKVNLLELNKSYYVCCTEMDKDFTKLWGEMDRLNLDIFSASGSWGIDNNMYSNVSDLVNQGVIVNRSAGNLMTIKNTTTSYKWKEVFMPYFKDFSKSKGAFVVVQAATFDGVYKSGRSQLGITKNFGITVMETGMGATSQATATFSGICALLLEYNKKHNKGFTPREVVATLFETATDIGEKGVDAIFGYGLVNVEAALKRLEKGIKPSLNPYSNLDVNIKAKVEALPDK